MTDQTDTTIEHAHRYDAAMADRIETLWQEAWASEGVFTQPNPGEPGFDASKPKYYCLDMFPYPSGAGLHVGHPEGYTATDIVCRYKRANGFNVLHPMGFDAFGLPAEQYALQTNVHPAITTRKAMATFRRQLKRFGFCYDWTREVATIDEDYYRWTQWIFLRLYGTWYDEHAQRARPIDELLAMLEHGDLRIGAGGELTHVGAVQALEELGGDPGLAVQWHELDPDDRRAFIDAQRLAFLDEQTVNWCPRLGTVLANEEVIDGKSERGGFPVVRKPLRQWLLRITAYADRLLGGLDGLRWPESTRAMQTEWIGKSTGAEIDFALDIETDDPAIDADLPPALRVFTTRPDTVFGSTYMVVAPEHPLVAALLKNPRPRTPVEELAAYVEAARSRTDIDRQGSRDKTGVFTGLHAINPATGERIEVWTADYVLMGYGFGAIMAVPAHDQRDFEFAAAHGLPIRDVVYARPIAVMAWFAANACDADQTAERWAGVLADLIALAVARDAPPADFGDLYEIVRTRRAADPTGSAVAIHPGEAASSEPGAVGARRGVQSIGWLDTLEALGLTSFDTLRDRFASATFHACAGEAYSGEGYLANSSTADSTDDGVSLDGLAVDEAKTRIIDWLKQQGLGRAVTNYRLRDWLFSRQRYWGEPFPIVFDERGRHWPVHEDHLPVALPPMDDFHPVESDEPTALLSKATDWLRTTAGAAGVDGPDPDEPVTREANTMPNWAGSCWYYLRYCDPTNSKAFASRQALDYWLGETGVDLYIGGAEHAVLHLLYARFWHKVLFDLGLVPCDEPFGRLFHQGLITSFAYQRADRSLVPVDEVEERGGRFVEIATGDEVKQITAKMSKSLRNVINPDDVIAQYGADTFRLYEMYLGPLEHSKPWNPRDIGGLFRFLQRLWRVVIDERTGEVVLAEEADDALERALHRTIAKVGGDIERLALNTAIAALIEFVNEATARRERDSTHLSRSQAMRLAQIVMPFAPHIAEELWSRLGQAGFVSNAPWPTYDEAMLVDDQVEIPIQILGKVRSHITIPADADAKTIEALALAAPRVQELIAGKTVRKVIVVPGRLVNLVVG